MFEPLDTPRIFGMPLGADFPRELVRGLLNAYAAQPPEALARVHVVVNTRRMARRIRALFDAGPALLLPRISLVTDFGEVFGLARVPEPVPPLRRRLELITVVSALLDQEPDLAPRAALYDLSDSLAQLMDEMHGEGVVPGKITRIDTNDQSGHWERIKTFLGILSPYFEASGDAPDAEARQRLVIETYARLWQDEPPDHPIILAGSTGSRGATRLLMKTVAQLPLGAVVLPGFDTDQPDHVWEKLNDPRTSEEHPQYRFAQLLSDLGADPSIIRLWPGTEPVSPERNRLVSLALRPAPVTDEWLSHGPALAPDIAPATAGMTLLEAPSARMEALCIAMRLREAVEQGQTAALITPDRTLTRRVASALDRWGLHPDDSAGVPLHHSAPGRFLRHVAEMLNAPLDAAQLLTLLKHPLTNMAGERGPHLRLTRELELYLRRNGPPEPDLATLETWAATVEDPYLAPWLDWLRSCFFNHARPEARPLTQIVDAHIALSEAISRGPDPDAPIRLWDEGAGREAQKCVSNLAENAGYGQAMRALDYINLFHAILSRETVRSQTDTDPRVLIWGTLEARVQGADLLILSGLNEGTWPEAPPRDPWLNREMRHEAGLLLPERKIGLSAHDFQQAVTATPTVWITRAIRSDDAQTVPSRWLNRLTNLLQGLNDEGGKAALDAMKQRGRDALALAEAFETVAPTPSARRPAPIPPVAARPKELSVTRIEKLIRDPYAIYADKILRLRPLDPLMKLPDARLRGEVLHDVLEHAIKDTLEDPDALTPAYLTQKTVSVLEESVPWGEARALWFARMARIAAWFVETEAGRRALARPSAFEEMAKACVDPHDFTLTAKADRIDIDASGGLHIYDYKTGAPPSAKAQKAFEKQLLLEAALAERAGFGNLAPGPVARAVFIGLTGDPREVLAPLDEVPTGQTWAELSDLVARYLDPGQGYLSRRAMKTKDMAGDYDQLARFGEWDITDEADPERVGKW
ncbi:PD-(D/E)XK nuclease superfamily protein [Roseovarius sp. THAF9]|uniref:double-strand break repair protein AddB n=1 Tax=Roseovarius sp. THAF9 TaxID=2587847 RepID=UPI00126905F2|nr:double-strand break repair protein AddB [Roseovarius sp. THAF9]QFT94957.1 PD-(D/E)XK nuclease superfamily protein [Roseovarius sp. THAF9]